MLLVPALLFYLMFWAMPVVLSLIQSLTTSTGNFGFANFQMMFNDTMFSDAFINTILFAIISLVIQFVLALGFSTSD